MMVAIEFVAKVENDSCGAALLSQKMLNLTLHIKQITMYTYNNKYMQMIL